MKLYYYPPPKCSVYICYSLKDFPIQILHIFWSSVVSDPNLGFNCVLPLTLSLALGSQLWYQ